MLLTQFITKATDKIAEELKGRSSRSHPIIKREPNYAIKAKGTLALSTRGMHFMKIKNQKMTGGIFGILKLKRQFDEMEKERMKTLTLLQKLEKDDDEALIREAYL